MMDADTDIRSDTIRVTDQNGVQYDDYGSIEKGVAIEVNGNPDNTFFGQSLDGQSEVNGNKMVNPSTQEVEELIVAHVENNGSLVSQEVQTTTETSDMKEPNPQNNRVKGKNENPTKKINAISTSVKKNMSNKEVKATLNGTLSTNTHTKQPIIKAKSFNEHHGSTGSNPNKTLKPGPASSNPPKTKPLKSEVISGSDNLVQSEDVVKTPKLRPLKKESTSSTQGIEENAESPTASDDSKSRRVGKLPSYGFNFRCHERAEKRKEFFTKLEEKIHAQEVEKSNMQAKSKETQEAEIKMFRKSLNFKATPMPNFYQEPAPTKELKKIPTTRPRSPKLGRKKNPSSMDTEGNHENTLRLGRLSLDEKAVSQTNPSKAPSSTQPKRPQRKSLPRLPSEKTHLSKNLQSRDKPVNGAPSISQVEDVDKPDFTPIARVNEEFGLSNPGPTPIARASEESGEAQSEGNPGPAPVVRAEGDPDLDQAQLGIQQKVEVEN